MKLEIKIPKGWRRLRKGEVIALGDRWAHPRLEHAYSEWQTAQLGIGRLPVSFLYIRKINRRKK